jgi:hypothetical protein
VLDATQSAQGLGLMLTTQISQPNSRILHLSLGSHKERLVRAKMIVGVLCKWSRSSNPQERGWMPFYSVSGKLGVGLSDQISQTNPPYRSDRLGDPQLAQATL